MIVLTGAALALSLDLKVDGETVGGVNVFLGGRGADGAQLVADRIDAAGRHGSAFSQVRCHARALRLPLRDIAQGLVKWRLVL